MTQISNVLDALVPLIADLAQDDLPAELRYQRLLDALRRLLPCDAIALLRLDGGALVPLAVLGLSADTLGRRFAIDAHPRLRTLLESPRAMRFPVDCALPDPYDGLVEGRDGDLEVHDCMGCALRVGQDVWGLLTLDALDRDRFSRSDLRILDTFAGLATATVAAMTRFQQLSRSVEDARRKAEAYRLAAREPRHQLVGRSPAYRQMISEIDLVAPSDLTVLITGETGVGKELVARRLHAESARADNLLVTINCAALPENLVESELFGHVRGAFSGAVSDRPGRFDAADGGTLFLDEIGELPLRVQAKLLRVLQDGQLQRVGSDREHRVNVRLIAATNRSLADEVRAGRFRADLYHRLSIFPLQVPPLRERRQDIPLLAGAFLEENRRRMGIRALRLAPAAQDVLVNYAWPGNARELEHLIARAALRAEGRHADGKTGAPRSGIVTLTPDDLDIAGPETAMSPAREEGLSAGMEHVPPGAADLRSQVDAFQKHLIERSLREHDGNLAATARALGLDRANLTRLAARLGVPVAKKRTAADTRPDAPQKH
ncbi:nitric oxide reductase transcriptional regulator NorR [Burkholderia sp. WAC0059]|uniref:nitric oxide reductase transcriptional regulator NorR n=1 Tax=Burkholderia sp. WAC0059 TaxID=2066022 RepID=UPI000C7F1106|nr:nitric oxide reductase transcriptional regulator NorR [Burkholderia sp. WAC0059]PLZ02147.1 nitric oxide reductase transcriptional regulator NorR [Burkholderia sp. WAC0059]